MIDGVDLLIRVLGLVALGMVLLLLLRGRQWARGVLVAGVFGTMFRLSLLRAASLHNGFFPDYESYLLFHRMLRSGWLGLVFDLMILVGSVLFLMNLSVRVARQQDEENRFISRIKE